MQGKAIPPVFLTENDRCSADKPVKPRYLIYPWKNQGVRRVAFPLFVTITEKMVGDAPNLSIKIDGESIGSGRKKYDLVQITFFQLPTDQFLKSVDFALEALAQRSPEKNQKGLGPKHIFFAHFEVVLERSAKVRGPEKLSVSL